MVKGPSPSCPLTKVQVTKLPNGIVENLLEVISAGDISLEKVAAKVFRHLSTEFLAYVNDDNGCDFLVKFESSAFPKSGRSSSKID